MDPVYLGEYPEDGLQLFGSDMPKYTAKDMETIAQPLDFFTTNIYNGRVTRVGKDGKPEKTSKALGHPLTMMEWTMTPDSLYWGPKFFYERYKKPIPPKR